MKSITRGVFAAASCATAAGLVLGLQAPAVAATKLSVLGGYGLWSADPSGGDPGDAIKACDTAADGWGIRVTLTVGSTGATRVATTQGHASPYCTTWKTGNLPEGTYLQVRVNQVKTNSSGGLVYGDATSQFFFA